MRPNCCRFLKNCKTSEQTYHWSGSSARSGMGNQARQGVLLTRSVDYVSIVRHHDRHLLHHLDSRLLPAARRRKSGRVQPTGFVPGSERRRRAAAFESLRSRAPPSERRRGGGSERAVQHTCLFLSVTLEVCDRGRWVCFFFPSTEWVLPCCCCLASLICASLAIAPCPDLSPALFRLQISVFCFLQLVTKIQIKARSHICTVYVRG